MKKNNIILWVLAFVMIAAAASVGIVALVKATGSDQTKSLTALNYQIGSIDAEGKFVKDTGSIVTKDYIPLDGLKLTLKKDASVGVVIALFDKDHQLIGADALELNPEEDKAMTFDYAEDYLADHVDTEASCALIIITPKHDAEVSFFEIAGYAKQVSVTYNK